MRRPTIRLILPTFALLLISAPLGSVAIATQEITIALAGPMSGDLHEFGAQMKHGAEKAVADINAAGGILGRKLTLEVGDDLCDPKRAEKVAKELVRKRIAFVTGHFCSASSIAASGVYRKNGVLQITPASSNPKLTDLAAEDGWDTLFRTCGRDDQQGVFAGAWIAKHFSGKNVAIIDDGGSYGRDLAKRVRETLHRAGMKEVANKTIDVEKTDYEALVRELKAAKPDVVYLGGYHDGAASIVRHARQQGLNAQFLAGDALNTLVFTTMAGKASDGVMFTNAAEARNLPTAQSVVQQFRKAGVEPEGYTLSTYAAIQLWAQAVSKAGTTDSEKVAAALRSQQWNTVIGRLSFDAKGDLKEQPFVWYIFKNGRYYEAGSE